MRVWIPALGKYTYPDVTAVCDTPRFQDGEADTLLNPTLIIEVLSPSTESYDRGKKFEHYRAIESLEVYVLIPQDERRIERFVRQPGGQWLFTDGVDERGSAELAPIGCRLTLTEVYEKVLEPSPSRV